MSLVIFDNTNTPRDVLEVQDLAANKFACIAGVAEPIVSTDATLTGTGSSVNPLSVVATAPWILAGDAGVNQTISPGNTATFVGVGVMLTTGVATDILNIEIAPGVNGDVLTTVAGVPTWQAPVSSSFFITDGVTTETVFGGNTITFVDGNDITVTVSAVDTVTITNVRPAQAGACTLGYFTGV